MKRWTFEEMIQSALMTGADALCQGGFRKLPAV